MDASNAYIKGGGTSLAGYDGAVKNMKHQQSVSLDAQPPVNDIDTRKDGEVKRRPKRRWQSRLIPYLFISPFLLFFVLLFIGPTIYSLLLSFYRYKGYGTAHFIGLANYSAILENSVFRLELWNTAFYWVVHVIPMMILAFLLALLLRSKWVKGRSWVQPILFLPNVMAIVASALVFQTLFGPQYGIINQLFGLKIDWIHDYTYTRYIVVLIILWRNIGWWFIVFLAGLTSINPDLEEAALIDGATALQRLWYVILPLMRNSFLFALVFDAVGSLRLFTEPNVLAGTGGSPASPEIAPLLNLLVQNLNDGAFGQAAAAGWILFVLGVIIVGVFFRLFGGKLQENE